MLDIWSDHSAHQHLARLDVVIVVLILIEVRMCSQPVTEMCVQSTGACPPSSSPHRCPQPTATRQRT